MEIQVLQEMGLTKNESKVYLFLLNEGSSTITEITNKLPIHRVNVYDILKRLKEKGLVSYTIEGKKKFYTATDPNYFLEILKKREDLFEKILPSLESKKKSVKEKHEARIFQGKNGIKAIMEDILKEKKTIYVFGAEGKYEEALPIYFKQFNKERQKRKIKFKIIYSKKIRELRKRQPIPYSDLKYIPKEYDSPSTTLIYGNKVAIIMWTEFPIGILIESKELNKSYMNFWEILWKIAKK